jgi:hypothetical protein
MERKELALFAPRRIDFKNPTAFGLKNPQKPSWLKTP